MASNNLQTITQQTTPTNSMKLSLGTSPAWVTAANPAGNITLFNDNPSPTTPNYTRNGTTAFFYTWNTFGKITAITKPDGSTLAGCAII
jgi:YD repeat-containing protein